MGATTGYTAVAAILLGTCGKSRWREDIVLPMLKSAGLDSMVYNPVVPDWNEAAQKKEDELKSDPDVLQVYCLCDPTGRDRLATSYERVSYYALFEMATAQPRSLVAVVIDDYKDFPHLQKVMRKILKDMQSRGHTTFETAEDLGKELVRRLTVHTSSA